MNLLKKLLPLALLLILFTACEKENSVFNSDLEVPELVEYSESNPLITRASGDGSGILLECITIFYPFGLVTEDGSVSTFESNEDFELLTEEEFIFVDFSYPLNVSVDDVESTINNGEELGNLFALCVPSGGWEDGEFPAYDITYENSCYTLNYPIQLINLENEITTVESEEELIDALSEEIYFFVFPFDMTHEDDEVITVNNNDEIFEALIECNGFYGDEGVDWEEEFESIGCFLFTFPFDVVTDTGEVITVSDPEEFTDLILIGIIVDFSYPITLVDLDGNPVVANSTEEFQILLNECEGWDDGGNNGPIQRDLFDIWVGTYSEDGAVPCYEIDFPISFTNTDDNTVLTFNNQDEYDEQFLEEFPNLGSYTGNYPMTVTYISNGEVFTINVSEDIETLLEGCE